MVESPFDTLRGLFLKHMSEKETIKTIEVIDKLYDSGDLRLLIASGLIDPCVLEWRKIYHAYMHRMKTATKKKKTTEDVGAIFDRSGRTVYNILDRFNLEIKK